MFGFGKKRALQPTEQPAPPPTAGEIYVMPEKYLAPAASGGNKGLIIASAVLILVIVLTIGVFIYDWVSRQAAVTEEPALTPPVVELETPPVEENLPTEEVTSTPATTTVEQTPVVTSTATTTAETSNQPTKISLDTDVDGLTDMEETVLGSTPTKTDTDGDGYKDGIEVLNGYSPTSPGSTRLSESPAIVSLTSDFTEDNYSLIYPKDWTASLVKANKQLLITAGSGEVLKVTVRENQGGLSPLAWYLQDHPEVAVSQLKLVSSQDGQLSGIYSPDGFTAYLTNTAKTKFYVFEYLSGRQTEFRYPVIFEAIIKSLKVLPPAVAVPEESTATTTE
jgi:hypothetical protein